MKVSIPSMVPALPIKELAGAPREGSRESFA